MLESLFNSFQHYSHIEIPNGIVYATSLRFIGYPVVNEIFQWLAQMLRHLEEKTGFGKYSKFLLPNESNESNK